MRPRLALAVAASALLAVALLAACGSSTDGTPGGTPPPQPSTPPASSTPDFPSSAPETSATAVSSEPVASVSSSAEAQPLSTKTVTASDGTVYAVAVWADVHSDDCAAHAYGQVAQYLASHDCTGVRQLLATTAIDGRAVGFEQNFVGFAGGMNKSYKAAGQFSELVSKNGTGNIDDLLREGYRLPAGPDQVPSPDAFKALGQDAGVVVTDAWYLTGATPENDPPLVKMAEDLFLQI